MLKTPFGNFPLGAAEKALIELRSEITACLIRHRGFADLPPENVAAEYENGMLGRGDAEFQYGIEFPFLSAYSADTIVALQQEVLQKFPDWAIIVAPACTEVRANSVTTADGHTVVDVAKHMDELRKAEAERRDETVGVVDRQYEWMKPRIPQLLNQLKAGRTFVIAGIFDRVRRKKDFYSVWILAEEGDVSPPYASVPLHEPTTSGSGLPVNDDGLVYRRPFAIVNGKKEFLHLGYSLECWHISKSYDGDTLNIIDESRNVTDCVPFDRSEVIRDLDLPRTVTRK